MVDSVVNTLGAGSGIDITSLVNQLVDAQFSAKTRAINTQNQKVSAQISGVSQLKSSITDFAAGLKSLATGGLLTTAPTTSNPAIASATAWYDATTACGGCRSCSETPSRRSPRRVLFSLASNRDLTSR